MIREGVLEILPIGILIFDPAGTPILANRYAERLCRQLMTDTESVTDADAESSLPQPIHRIHQAVVESQEYFPERSIIIEDTVPLTALTQVAIRARWLNLEVEPYVLVMLETQQTQVSESEHPNSSQLSEQEMEIWLLQQAGYTHTEIAVCLQTSVAMVKRHIQAIEAKHQQQWSDMET